MYNDLIGSVFNNLTIVDHTNKIDSRESYLCKCVCGNYTRVILRDLKNNHTKSCGCYTKYRNPSSVNGKRNRIYTIWIGIKTRCLNITSDSYNNYGGRGITICEEWLDFDNFADWSKENGYRDDLTIDRINNDGNYEPINCRWINSKNQQNNKRNTIYLTINNETKPLSIWCEEYNIDRKRVSGRIRLGWDPLIALTKPKRGTK